MASYKDYFTNPQKNIFLTYLYNPGYHQLKTGKIWLTGLKKNKN